MEYFLQVGNFDFHQNALLVPLTIVRNPVDTGRKLNVHKKSRRRPGRLLNVLCTFNLRPVSTGKESQPAIAMNKQLFGFTESLFFFINCPVQESLYFHVFLFQPINDQCFPHIQTGKLICTAN